VETFKMFNPQKDDYPLNEAGVPEFASIIIHVDAALVTPNDDDVTQKLVLSTQDVVTSLTKLAAHFGEPELLAQPSNARLLVEAGRQANPVFVYTTPREGTVLILTSTPVWDMLVQHPDFGRGSALIATDKIQDIAAQVQSQMQQFAGGFANLLLLDLSPEKFEESLQKEPGMSASSDGGRGSDAESLVHTADIEEVQE
jgi:hypothetical protein